MYIIIICKDDNNETQKNTCLVNLKRKVEPRYNFSIEFERNSRVLEDPNKRAIELMKMQ